MPRPDHLRFSLIAQLRRHIESCHAPGEPLPSQRELAETYGGTPSTVRRALRALQKEGAVVPRPRVGWVRARDGDASGSRLLIGVDRPLRVGLISRRTRGDWKHHNILMELLNEAQRRGVQLVEVPNPRKSYPTRARARVEIVQIPWNTFDVGMLVEIEDPVTLESPLLTGKRLLSVDQDSTAFGLNSISFANWEAGAIAARYLYGLGHRRFAVTDEVNSEDRVCDPSWTARRLGFESTLGTLGGIIRPEWRLAIQRGGIHNPAFNFRKTIRNWRSYAADDRPTALFAVSGLQLGAAIHAMRDIGMSIPDDMSIVMVTWDMGERFVADLELSVIYLNFEQMIRRSFEVAAEVARRPIPSPGTHPLHIVLPVKLVEGKSTRSRQVKTNEYL